MKTLLDEDALLECFTSKLHRASEFRVATALITERGLALIRDPLESCLRRGGSGRILFGIDLPTEPRAITLLLTLRARYKNVQVRRFQQGRRAFHPKMALFFPQRGSPSAIIGSSNLTVGGLATNHEVNVLLDRESTALRHLVDYFDEQFEGAHAVDVEQAWLDEYEGTWPARNEAIEREKEARLRSRALDRPPKATPTRIAGKTFAFTGKISAWPRRRLYPYIARLNGNIVQNAARITSAQCLVHGEILGGRTSTKKLVRARSEGIPIITEEHFLKLLAAAGRRIVPKGGR